MIIFHKIFCLTFRCQNYVSVNLIKEFKPSFQTRRPYLECLQINKMSVPPPPKKTTAIKFCDNFGLRVKF